MVESCNEQTLITQVYIVDVWFLIVPLEELDRYSTVNNEIWFKLDLLNVIAEQLCVA